jgi:MarR family transcriptional regulator, transcriptional regulator for hemolysin
LSTHSPYDSLGFLVNKTSRALLQLFNKRLQEAGIELKTDHVFLLLKITENNNVLSQQQLAELICTDKATVTRYLDLLENEQLIERKNDTIDRRNKRIEITEKGKLLMQKINSEIKTVILDQISEDFTPKEEQELKRLLNKLYANISDLNEKNK